MRFVKLEYTMKNWPTTFLTGKFAFFFIKLCFQQPLKSWRNDLITSTVFVRIVFGPLKPIPWGLSNSKIWEKKPKFFLNWKYCLFLKNCVFNKLSSPEEMILFFQANCHTSFWTNMNCPLRFITLDIRRKIGPKTFLNCKVCLSFKILCFQQPPRS